MVSRVKTTALFLLTLLVMTPAATADDSSSTSASSEAAQNGPCNIWYIRAEFPFIDVHEECIESWLPQ